MFFLDMPNALPQNAPVMIARANQAQPSTVPAGRTVGICHTLANGADSAPSLENVVEPKGEAQSYLWDYEKRDVADTVPATVTILQQPAHGILRLVTEADRGTLFSSSSGPIDPSDPGYAYLPKKGYLGKDKAIALVEIGGVKVKVIYFFQAVDGPTGDVPGLCGKRGYRWKISFASGDAHVDSIAKRTVNDQEYR